MEASASQTFSDHIGELRIRLLWCFLAIGLSAGTGYVFRDQLVTFLQKPLGAPLFYFNPAGSFNFVIKVSVFAGVIVALPIFIYQLIRFIEPALNIRLKTFSLLKLIISAMVLAVLGVAFAYFVIVPTSLHFFAGYSSAQIKPLISADDYLSFIISCLVTFALLFQIPLVILFIDRIRPMKPGDLMKYQRHMIVAAFVLSVVLPFTYDPTTQFVMAIPIVFLFYLSVGLLVLAQKQRNRKVRKVTRAHVKVHRQAMKQHHRAIKVSSISAVTPKINLAPPKCKPTPPAPSRAMIRSGGGLVIDGLAPKTANFGRMQQNQKT